MGPQIVLVHAPLVGPSMWRWVAQNLASRGVEVVVPHLRLDTSAEDPFDQLVSKAASDVVSDEVVLVGHSGAGLLLPFIAEASSSRSARFVFVDAGLPPLEGRVEPASEEFRTFLRSHADATGVLPPWHTWWGPEGMQWLVPDEQRRAIVTADIPQLPLSYFDSVPEVPRNWAARAAGFVLLSELYRVWADQARALGWNAVELFGTHLELVNRPEDVAEAIMDVARLS
jgi:hypothetical protein